MRMSIRRKVMLLVLGTTVSALALSAVGLVIYDLRAYERQWTEDLYLQAEILARASAPALSFHDAQGRHQRPEPSSACGPTCSPPRSTRTTASSSRRT